MSNKTIKTVVVSDQGVKFGNAWFSHESITGYPAEQLNSGAIGITGEQYMLWLSTDNPGAACDEAKERELFMQQFPLPSNVQWSEDHQNFGWVRKDAFQRAISYRALWSGWLACAKSKTGIQP